MAELSRFDELRTKTERQLVQLINNELERGIREARQALTAETRAFAERHYVLGQRAHAEALRLIPLVEDTAPDRAEERVEHLREMLDKVSIRVSTPTSAGESIAPLARALWKARAGSEGSPDDDWRRAEEALKFPRALHAGCS